MGKAPAFQFYPADWLRDTQVQMATMETKGVWIEVLCRMWFAPQKGKLEATVERLANLLHCEMETLIRAFNEIQELKIGDLSAANGDGSNVTFPLHVTQRHILVTVINRRMFKENKVRNNARLRKQKQRKREASHTDVTPPSSSSTPSSSSPKNKYTIEFEQFWNVYPKKVGKIAALKAWKNAKSKPDIKTLIKIISRFINSEQWKKENGQFIPNPATWLNQGRWDDQIDNAGIEPSRYLTDEEKLERWKRSQKDIR